MNSQTPIEVRIEQLLGRRLLDQKGRAIGRIEEFRAEREGTYWTITAYVLGPHGLMERLSATGPWMRICSCFGVKARPPQVVASERVDLSDPERPRLSGGD